MVDALLVASSFLPGRGGIESYLADLCRNVSPRVAVLAQNERDGRPMPTNLGYPVIGLPRKLRADHRLIQDIVQSAKTLNTHKVLFGSAWPLPLVAPALRRHGIRYAIVAHGAEFFIPAAIPFVRRRLRRAFLGADTLFAVSTYTERRLRNFIGQEDTGETVRQPLIRRMKVILDTSRFQPALTAPAFPPSLDGLPPDAQIVLHVGRLVKRKGIDRLIRALPAVVAAEPRALLVIAGTGPEEQSLRKLAKRKNVSALFLGSVPEAEIPALYASAAVFALPVASRWFGYEFEGLGIVLLEAAACRTPAVVGRSGGTPEAVIDGETGFVINGKSEDQLVDKIVLLLSNEDLRRKMGDAALDYVRQNFSAAESQTALVSWLRSS